MYINFGKRFFDLVLSIFLVTVLSPLLLSLTVIIWLASGSNPFFVQSRPGRNEVLFSIIKFKTMTNDFTQEGELQPDELRITRLGSFLRKSSLDELPQLINILKGEMSFVGPRPLLPEYLPLYNSSQRKRHHVLPGLTGLAQVSGRNLLSWKEKFDLDIQYINTMSLLIDLKILYRTFFIGSKGIGIRNTNNAQVERFTG
jgi:undecaprenyl phosphate N,N'-diacetylbacillosamine 1-phosphate transferase